MLLLLDRKFARLMRHRPSSLRLTAGVRLWTSIDPRLVNKRTVKWSTSRGTNIAGRFCRSATAMTALIAPSGSRVCADSTHKEKPPSKYGLSSASHLLRPRGKAENQLPSLSISVLAACQDDAGGFPVASGVDNAAPSQRSENPAKPRHLMFSLRAP